MSDVQSITGFNQALINNDLEEVNYHFNILINSNTINFNYTMVNSDAISYACFNNHIEVIEFLCTHIHKEEGFSYLTSKFLTEAIKGNNIELFKIILKYNESANFRDLEEAIRYCSVYGRNEALKFLLEQDLPFDCNIWLFDEIKDISKTMQFNSLKILLNSNYIQKLIKTNQQNQKILIASLEFTLIQAAEHDMDNICQLIFNYLDNMNVSLKNNYYSKICFRMFKRNCYNSLKLFLPRMKVEHLKKLEEKHLSYILKNNFNEIIELINKDNNLSDIISNKFPSLSSSFKLKISVKDF